MNKAFNIIGIQDNYNAELQAIEFAIKTCPNNFNLIIYTDRQSSIDAITNSKSYTKSQQRAASNKHVLSKILTAIEYRENNQRETKLKYVEAHVGIFGNEKADKLAKFGCLEESIINTSDLEKFPVLLSYNNEIIESNISITIKQIGLEVI